MDSTVDEMDLPQDMIMDFSSMPPTLGFLLSASGVLHRALDDGSVSLGLSHNCSDLQRPMTEASLAWSSAKLHHTTMAQDSSSPHL